MRTVLGLVALLAACGDGGGASPDGGPGTGECPQWTVRTYVAPATATIAGGELVVQTPSVPAGPALTVSREIVEADFDVTFQVAGVTLGGVGAYVRARIESASGASTYIGMRQTADEVRVESRTVPIGVETFGPTLGSLVTLRFARVAGEFEALARADDVEAGISDLGLADTPLTLMLELGGSEANGDPTAARFSSFDVAVGTATPDPFDCDRML